MTGQHEPGLIGTGAIADKNTNVLRCVARRMQHLRGDVAERKHLFVAGSHRQQHVARHRIGGSESRSGERAGAVEPQEREIEPRDCRHHVRRHRRRVRRQRLDLLVDRRSRLRRRRHGVQRGHRQRRPDQDAAPQRHHLAPVADGAAANH